jgi:hypothetical protein
MRRKKKQAKVYMLQFDGDLPRTRGLEIPEFFDSKEAALRRIEKLFIRKGPYPDIEDDRILLWEAVPGWRESRRVVWAFLGWHWVRDGLPGIKEADDILPASGKSLYQLCNEA